MSFPPLPLSLLGSGFPTRDVLPFLGGIAVALIGALSAWFVARRSSAAPLQTTLNDAFRALMKEYQDQHSADIAHISALDDRVYKLEGQCKVKDSEIESLRGELRQFRQLRSSSERLES